MSLHGGDIYKIYRENGKKVIDYSANINSLGFPKKLKKNIIRKLLRQNPTTRSTICFLPSKAKLTK